MLSVQYLQCVERMNVCGNGGPRLYGPMAIVSYKSTHRYQHSIMGNYRIENALTVITK